MRKIVLLLVLVLSSALVIAQTRIISGKVTDEKGQPAPFASVHLKGTKSGTAADANGYFSIKAKSGDVLVISEIGTAPTEVTVGSDNSITVVLKGGDKGDLGEVVVTTAAGTKVSKRQQGFNTTVISHESITNAQPTTLASALAGKVPGLQVMATGGGVNPNFRITIRGQRSLLGNNQPLLILDGNIVTYDMLSNINPEDIENTNVLNGPSAVALYGSQASNGALVITTIHPTAGTQQIHVAHTTTFEHVAFFPKEQEQYGSGGSGYGTDNTGKPIFSSIENESYGPAFDGSIVDLGGPLENGDQLTAPYSFFKDRNDFWQTGVSDQSDFSLSSADERSSFYVSGQYLNTTGTALGDKFTRASIRINGTKKIGTKVHMSYGISYLQNRYNISTAETSVYDQFLNMPGNIPITLLKDWQTNEYANPNGYYNPWYPNPYFSLANNRGLTNNDYLTGSLELHYTPLPWLDLVSSTGYTMRSETYNDYTNPFTYTSYAFSQSNGSKSNVVGSVAVGSQYYNEILQDFKAIAQKKFGNLSVSVIGGFHIQQDYQNNIGGSVSALVDSALYNLGNSTNSALGSNSIYEARQAGAYYDVQLGWKNFLFLHTTGRQDWISILDPSNRTFFYPSVDASLILTNAIKSLGSISWLNTWKIRGAVSKVGEVNLSSTPYGAYELLPTYSQGNGYPYNGAVGEQMSSTLVQPNLQPEITKSWEVGTDFTLFHNIVDASVTWYDEHTNNQTVPTQISIASGFTNYLLNAGETQSDGLETSLKLTPINNKVWTVSLQSTYSYYNNKVISIPAGLQNLSLSSGYGYGGNTGSYAIPGYQFPEIIGTDYLRHDGKVIIDEHTGMPEINPNPVPLGNANAKNTIGLSPTIRFKSFTLEAEFEYRGGFVRYNDIGWDMDWSGMGIRSAEFNRQRFVYPNSVYQDGSGKWVDNTNILISENGNGNGGFWTDAAENMEITSNYISSGAYWKLRELSLTYQLPQSLLNRTKVIKSASVSLVGRNLFIWLPKDNFYTDPDYSDAGSGSNGLGITGYQTPPSRFYGFNISLNF